MQNILYIHRTLFTGIIFTENPLDYHITEAKKVIYPSTVLKYCKPSIIK
jgi:hypothetical protein